MLAGREASSEDPSSSCKFCWACWSLSNAYANPSAGWPGELDIALGLVNAYIRRCIKKGLVKVTQAPAGRIAYYLTPSGFAEKLRLTIEYLSYSFSFFRQAEADCSADY